MIRTTFILISLAITVPYAYASIKCDDYTQGSAIAAFRTENPNFDPEDYPFW